MGDLKKLYYADKTKEIEGVWEETDGGIKLKVARINNPTYTKVLNRLLKPHNRSRRRGSMSDELLNKLITKAMAETVLLAWENLKEDDKEMKYSVAEAERLMTEYPDFRDIVMDIASDMDMYRSTQDEESAKNSKKSSPGT